LKIRYATERDLVAILNLDERARVTRSRREWIRRAVRDRALFVLVSSGEVKAYAVLRRSFFERPFVEMLYVARTARRHGFGSALLLHLEENKEEIWTSTNRSNTPMRRLLAKHGFVRRGRVIGLDSGDAEMFYSKGKKPSAIHRAACGH
jgi:ribosomal protein S18 acetylase RimI-like enzyme